VNISIVGRGRAGTSFELALRAAGHSVRIFAHDHLSTVTPCDLILLCVPDDHVAEVARNLPDDDQAVVAHIAGSRTLEVLGDHPRVGSLHPLVALSSPEIGARRLQGATYSVAGDPLLLEVVESLGGVAIRIDDAHRAGYHAAACVAANHLVALMGHVGTLADKVGMKLDDFLPLAFSALEDVRERGPVAALTGPASRGDLSTIDAHLAAIPESERATYVALVNAALSLAEQQRISTHK
jgi:predicted short-subunit dehydrogenase-like oxidoreductase (DUF2520 family)